MSQDQPSPDKMPAAADGTGAAASFDRSALLLVAAGAGLAIFAALALWHREGAAVFLSAAGGMLLSCL